MSLIFIFTTFRKSWPLFKKKIITVNARSECNEWDFVRTLELASHVYKDNDKNCTKYKWTLNRGITAGKSTVRLLHKKSRVNIKETDSLERGIPQWESSSITNNGREHIWILDTIWYITRYKRGLVRKKGTSSSVNIKNESSITKFPLFSLGASFTKRY